MIFFNVGMLATVLLVLLCLRMPLLPLCSRGYFRWLWNSQLTVVVFPLQFTFEQHGFELLGSTYTWFFSSKHIGNVFGDVDNLKSIFFSLAYFRNTLCSTFTKYVLITC